MSLARAQLAAIQAMDRSTLLAAWSKRFGKAPPKYTSLKLMRSVLAWEAQAAIEGGLSPQVERILRDRARQLQKERIVRTDREDRRSAKGLPPAKRPVPPLLRPGVQLMREWNGRTYRVEVVENGFVMDGGTYGSLTAIAKRISGAHWSGPRFFGLINRRAS